MSDYDHRRWIEDIRRHPVVAFTKSILHGDANHQKWLMDTATRWTLNDSKTLWNEITPEDLKYIWRD